MEENDPILAEIPLHVSRSSRAIDIAIGLAGALIAALFLIGIAALIWGLVNRIAGVLVFGLTLPLVFLALRSSFRGATKRPAILLRTDFLEIRQPEIFEQFPMIPKAQVATAAVEDHSRQVRPWESASAFPIGDESEYTHLYDSDRGNPVPLVCSAWDLPNLVVLFREPYRFSTTKPFQWAMMAGPLWRMRLQFPNRNDDVMGFMTRVADPHQAQRALAGWGTSVGPVVWEQGANAFPGPATYRRRLARGPILAGLVLVGAVIIRVLAEAVTS